MLYLPIADLLHTVKASVWIVTGNVSHAKGEYPRFVSVLRTRDGYSL